MHDASDTAPQASTRRLAAVLIADVAGYSRLMERDEPGTHTRLQQIRAEVTDPATRGQGGRIVRTTGDGLLVEFPSAMAALISAIEIQRAMRERNAGLPAAERIEYRIGINLGDIIVDENDIAGNGVNVAARLEAVARPGGIAISATVRDQVRQDLGVAFVDAGEHHVKNISKPVRIFTVELQDRSWLDRLLFALRLHAADRKPRLAFAAVIVAVIAAMGVLFWPTPPPAGQSLIVLPFATTAGADDNKQLASALTDELTGAVSRISGVMVISPTVAARAAGLPDLKQVGHEFRVRYALEGRVENAGDLVRVAAHLVDASTGTSAWNGTVTVPRSADGTVPARLIGELADTLRAELRAAEVRRLAQQPAANESAYALALRAAAELPKTANLDEMRAVQKMFERAVALDDKHVPALIGLADTVAFISQRVDSDSERSALLTRADEASLRAVTLDPNDAEAWGTRAQVLMFRGQTAAASEAIERGQKLNPYFADLYTLRGQILLIQGRGEEALAELNKALELNPGGSAGGVVMNYRCRAFLLMARYDAAIESCERGTAFQPDWPDYMLLAAAYALKGDSQHAAEARAQLLKLFPRFTIAWRAAVAGRESGGVASPFEQQLYAGLRKAGVPEQ